MVAKLTKLSYDLVVVPLKHETLYLPHCHFKHKETTVYRQVIAPKHTVSDGVSTQSACPNPSLVTSFLLLLRLRVRSARRPNQYTFYEHFCCLSLTLGKHLLRGQGPEDREGSKGSWRT